MDIEKIERTPLPVHEIQRLLEKYRIMYESRLTYELADMNLGRQVAIQYTDTKNAWTNKDVINIGADFLSEFGVFSEEDMLCVSNYVLGHEIQHIRSTSDKIWQWGMKRGAEVCIEAVADTYGIKMRFNREADYEYCLKKLKDEKGILIRMDALGNLIHFVINSVCDGRIERIACMDKPGFKEQMTVTRGKYWVDNPIKEYAADELTESEKLRIVMDQILFLSTMNIYQKGFLKQFKGSNIEKEVKKLMIHIFKGTHSETCKKGMDQSLEIIKFMAPKFVKACEVDAEAVEKMITNLIKNAIKNGMMESGKSNYGDSEMPSGLGKGQKGEDYGNPFGTDLEVNLTKEEAEKLKEEMGDNEGSGGIGIKINITDGNEDDEGKETKEQKKDGQKGSSGDPGNGDNGKESGSGGSDSDSGKDSETENGNNGSGNGDSSESSEKSGDEEESGNGSGGKSSQKDEEETDSTGKSDKDPDTNGKNGKESDEKSRGGDSGEGSKDSEGNAGGDKDNAKGGSENGQSETAGSGLKENKGGESGGKSGACNGTDDAGIDEAMGKVLEAMKKAAEQQAESVESAKEVVNPPRDTFKEKPCNVAQNGTTEQIKADPNCKGVKNLYQRDPGFREVHRAYTPDLRLPFWIKSKSDTFKRKIEDLLKNMYHPAVRCQRSGIVDTGMVHKLALKNSEIFMKRARTDKFSGCCYILVDNSGSMGYGRGSKREYAWQAVAEVEAGYSILMPLKITAFDTDACVVHEVVKDWNEILKTSGAYNFLKKGRDGGGNMDGYSIAIATDELLRQRGEKKLLIVLSDGAPDSESKVKTAVEYARKNGVTVVGIYFSDVGNTPTIHEKKRFEGMYGTGRSTIVTTPDKISESLYGAMRHEFL